MASNLEEFAASIEPEEPTSRKLHKLLSMGYNRAQLIAGLRLLQDCPWSSATVEQLHGSTASIHKVHKEYGLSTLTGRSFLRQIQPLLKPTETETRLETMTATVERLANKPAGSIGGRQLYFKDLMSVLADWKARKHRPSDLKSGHKVMALHGQYYQQLSVARKRAYERQAVMETGKKELERQEALEEARSALRLEKARQAEEAESRNPLLIGTCSLTSPDFEAMDQCITSGDFTQSQVQGMRAAANTAPNAAAQAVLRQHPVWADRKWRRHPFWLRTVCQDRDSFMNTALVFKLPNSELRYFKFLYATQNPYFACFSTMFKEEAYSPVSDSLSCEQHYANDQWHQTFCIDFMDFQDHVDLVFP